MSYELVTPSDAEDRICFTYGANSLFNKIVLMSTYRAKNIKTEGGRSAVDDYSMSENERDFFKLQVEYALAEVYSRVVRLTTKIAGLTISTTGDSFFYIKDYDAYNTNVLLLVDKAIEKALINFILRDWYMHSGLSAEYGAYELILASSLNELTEKLFELRKPLLS